MFLLHSKHNGELYGELQSRFSPQDIIVYMKLLGVLGVIGMQATLNSYLFYQIWGQQSRS